VTSSVEFPLLSKEKIVKVKNNNHIFFYTAKEARAQSIGGVHD
jgi:hypothetical protein